jgi:ubiquinone/menaquinone biosynthesis C-methylase UbiE
MALIGLQQFVIPEVVVSHFHLREGDVVADFGAGSGYFLAPLEKAIGSGGVIYACEIQKQLVDKLSAVATEQRLSTVRPLWCDLEEPNGIPIQSGVLDVALLINSLFMLENKVAAVAEMARTLRPGGTFIVIDWTESFAGLGPQPAMVVNALAARDLFESGGFMFEREFPAGEHHYGLAFKKL